ncbi:hypothetical protein KAT84_04515 [Candidatus Bipolaricaulota bacterium]|nr:hypothetical protein [Candidatus Bipolaricaulota bacterium]
MGDETRVLRSGDGVCIPPNAIHNSARILDELTTKAYDAWGPPRDDYKS